MPSYADQKVDSIVNMKNLSYLEKNTELPKEVDVKN